MKLPPGVTGSAAVGSSTGTGPRSVPGGGDGFEAILGELSPADAAAGSRSPPCAIVTPAPANDPSSTIVPKDGGALARKEPPTSDLLRRIACPGNADATIEPAGSVAANAQGADPAADASVSTARAGARQQDAAGAEAAGRVPALDPGGQTEAPAIMGFLQAALMEPRPAAPVLSGEPAAGSSAGCGSAAARPPSLASIPGYGPERGPARPEEATAQAGRPSTTLAFATPPSAATSSQDAEHSDDFTGSGRDAADRFRQIPNAVELRGTDKAGIAGVVVPGSVRSSGHLGFLRGGSAGAVTTPPSERAGGQPAFTATHAGSEPSGPVDRSASGSPKAVDGLIPPGEAAAARTLAQPPAEPEDARLVTERPHVPSAASAGIAADREPPPIPAAPSDPGSPKGNDGTVLPRGDNPAGAPSQPLAEPIDPRPAWDAAATTLVPFPAKGPLPAQQPGEDGVVGTEPTFPEPAVHPVAPARSMALQVSAPSLGTVSVRLHLSDRALDVHLEASDGRTAALIDRDRHALAEALNDGDYQLQSLSVTPRDAPQPGSSHAERAADPRTGDGAPGNPPRGDASDGRAANREPRDGRRDQHAPRPTPENAIVARDDPSLFV